MPSLIDIRRRVRSVKNTQQITKAMKLVSAAKLRKAQEKAVVEDFARTDPYVTNGLVKSWRVREWMTVAGEESTNPVRPETA